MLIEETDTDFVTEAGFGALVERRRSGRQNFDNPHLVRLLRDQGVARAIEHDDELFEDEPAGERRPWFASVVLASVGFWYVILRLMI